jgi:hypothetical protein
MSKRALILWLAVSATPAVAADGRFGYLGIAPGRAGHGVPQFEAALGAALLALPGKAGAGCQQRATPSLPGVVFVVDRDVVTRVETRVARYATVSGVRVGDDVAKAQRIYAGRLTVTPHPYFEKGLMLALYSPDRRHALVMESNDRGRIITLRGGLVPAVEFLEGCSS